MFDLAQIVEPLLCWYDNSRRILPWRERPEPYRVWVSEIMLQQTRVEAVKPYYERFLQALPDIRHLAGADEDELLKLWEGLGYYNRVRNLQKAAVMIEEEYGGRMPDEYEELLKLPGIGSYTAGAVASIAYGRPVPAVDGNVLRILTRVLADDSDVLSAKVKKGFEERLAAVIPGERPGDFNQALMELGATVCIPNGAPKCGECPWQSFCKAGRAGSWQDYPKKAEKKPRSIEEKTVLIIRDENKAALKKRPAKGLLAGMYEFPSMKGHRSEDEVIAYVKSLGFGVIRIKKLEDAKHIFSHREWHMTGYAVRVDELEKGAGRNKENFIFAEPEETEERYPVPAAFARYTQYLKIRIGNGKFLSEV